MAHITTNRWNPDTCDCTFDLDFDSDLPDDQRVVTLHDPTTPQWKRLWRGTTVLEEHQEAPAPLKICPEHAALTDFRVRYTAVLTENQRKNRVQSRLQTFLGVTPPPADATVEEERTYENHIKAFSWAFDANRRLDVRYSLGTRLSLDTQQKADFQALLDADAEIGAGKVRVL